MSLQTACDFSPVDTMFLEELLLQQQLEKEFDEVDVAFG